MPAFILGRGLFQPSRELPLFGTRTPPSLTVSEKKQE